MEAAEVIVRIFRYVRVMAAIPGGIHPATFNYLPLMVPEPLTKLSNASLESGDQPENDWSSGTNLYTMTDKYRKMSCENIITATVFNGQGNYGDYGRHHRKPDLVYESQQGVVRKWSC